MSVFIFSGYACSRRHYDEKFEQRTTANV